MPHQSIVIGGQRVNPGERALIQLSIPGLYTQADMAMPVHIVHGRREGPRLFVSAAIHGDELNGIEIIRRLMASKALGSLRGTLIAVPVVNIYGLLTHSRYLPDRRDLNRSFPGSEKGPLASRLANVFMRDIVSQCTHGIDLHTGAIHRSNMPQIRANLDDGETRRLAEAFDVPVLLNASLRDGSLRAAAAELGIPMLLYEAGEALRLNEVSIRAGRRGILNVMRAIGMLGPSRKKIKAPSEPYIAHSSQWLRAPESGMLRTLVPLGSRVSKGDIIAVVMDPVTGSETLLETRNRGIVIGRSELPLVHEGDAVIHLARFEESTHDIAAQVEAFHMDLDPDAYPVAYTSSATDTP